MKYELANDSAGGLAEVGKEVIRQCHLELEVLRIAWVYRASAIKSANRVIYARAIAVSDLDWTLHHYDVIVEIPKDLWKDAPRPFKYALIDHQLSHVQTTGEVDHKTGRVEVALRHHDVEEFADVLTTGEVDHKTGRVEIALRPHDVEEFADVLTTGEVDHKTGRVEIALRHHDVEEFADVLKRHGARERK